jgi:hypothetical protein
MECIQKVVGKPLGRDPLGRLRRRKHNIKMDLRKIGCEDWKWMKLGEDCVQKQAWGQAVLHLKFLLPRN